MEKIKILDLSNKNLTELPDLTKNIYSELVYLNCSNNGLTSLKIPKELKSFKSLYCSGNNLESLSIAKECFNIEHIYCHDNKLTTFKIT